MGEAMVCCLCSAEWKILMGHRKPCSASPNKQTGQRRFFHPEEERVPYSGHSAAAQQAVSSAKAEEWALCGRATVVVVDEAMKGLLTRQKKVHVPVRNVSWHLPRPGASADGIPLYLSLLLVLGRWNYG